MNALGERETFRDNCSIEIRFFFPQKCKSPVKSDKMTSDFFKKKTSDPKYCPVVQPTLNYFFNQT